MEWARLSTSQRARLLRRIAQELGAETPDRDAVARACNALEEGRRAVELKGFAVRASCDQVYFRRPAQATAFRFERCADEWTCADLGWRLRGIDEAFPGCEVRFFQPGDRLGNGKLKERLLALRIPEPERHLLPVVATGETVHAFFPQLSTQHITAAPDIAWSFPSEF
jgi:hypothetical protein